MIEKTKGLSEVGWDVWNNDKDVEVESIVFNALYALNEEAYTCGAADAKARRYFTLRDHVALKVIGCYFPPKGRVFYNDTFDVKSDGIPGAFCLSGPGSWFNIKFEGITPELISVVFFPIKKAPKGIVLPRNGDTIYRAISYFFYEDGVPDRLVGNLILTGVDKTNVDIMTSYLSVNHKKETVTPCYDKRGYCPFEITRPLLRKVFCVAASANADRKFLWNVSVPMGVTDLVTTNVSFGVHEEHVKSLFYARESPNTATGRRRPIQHWVSSHKRRMKNGIDIDINQHLRGITDFEMYGFNFKIISPNRSGVELVKQREQYAKEILSYQPPKIKKEQLAA